MQVGDLTAEQNSNENVGRKRDRTHRSNRKDLASEIMDSYLVKEELV
jgi:hypothetical protein